MEKLTSLMTFGFGVPYKTSGAETCVDRLTSRATVALVVLLAVVCLWQGADIKCYKPSKEDAVNVDFINSQCRASTIYVTPEQLKDSPSPHRQKSGSTKIPVGYFSRIPSFLLLQALSFCIPSLLLGLSWQLTHLPVQGMLELVVKYNEESDKEEREKYFHLFTTQFWKFMYRKYNDDDLMPPLTFQLVPQALKRACFSNHLFISYLLVQLLSFVNTVLQMYFLGKFLQLDHQRSFNVHMLTLIGAFFAQGVQNSSYFPQSTFCDVIYTSGTHETYQCALANFWLYESLFVFIWLWYGLLCFAQFLSFTWWFHYLVASRKLYPGDWVMDRLEKVHNLCETTYVHVILGNDYIKEWALIKPTVMKTVTPTLRSTSHITRDSVITFHRRYIRCDEWFIYRMVALHTDTQVADLMLYQMWAYFRFQSYKTHDMSGPVGIELTHLDHLHTELQNLIAERNQQ